jgi:hypothetical protein
MSNAPVCSFKMIVFEELQLLGSHWSPVYSDRQDYLIGYEAHGTDCYVYARAASPHSCCNDRIYPIPQDKLIRVDGNTVTIPICPAAAKETP